MRVHTVEEYADQYDQLIPVGLAWDRYRDYALAKLLEAFAVEHTRLEGRAVNLVLNEFFPQSTVELLAEWETEWGLPDDCTPAGATIAERVEILLRKIRSLGGQSIQYFIDLMVTMGIAITIQEFKPFRVGLSVAGDHIYSVEWSHVFQVVGPPTRTYHFRAGINCAGDPLRYWRSNDILECIINKLKPAHAFVIIGYEDYGTFFLGVTDDGDVYVRDNVRDGSTSPIFRKDGETGDVLIRTIIEDGAEDLLVKKESPSENVTLKELEE